jgi:hypothetical protein
MHRSRVVAALIDVPASDFDAETRFWSGLTGRTAEIDPADPDYADLGSVGPGLSMMVQRVDDSARIHLDVETDDIEAEVARLEGLGARRLTQIQTWWVMADPAGLPFCVIRVQHPEDFERFAASWP